MPAKTVVANILMSACMFCEVLTCLAQGEIPTTTVDAKVEVDKFLGTSDYRQMKQYPIRWSDEMSAEDRKQIVIELSSRLISIREVSLTNYADTFVYSRLQSGDVHSRLQPGKMRFPGHGRGLWQDVFLENGRCAWAIEQMLHCRLPTFTVEVAHDPKKLEENVRQSFFKVIEAMDMPEKPKPAEPKPVESRIKPRYRDFSGQPPATNEKNPIKDEPAKTKSFPRPDVRQRKPFVNDESGATKAFPKRE
jgi:hypothetical protein